MQLIRGVSKAINSIGRKMSSDAMHSLGQKALHGARVLGRKAANTINKIEEYGTKALPLIEGAASAAGYSIPAQILNAARKDLGDLAYVKNKVNDFRKVLNG